MNNFFFIEPKAYSKVRYHSFPMYKEFPGYPGDHGLLNSAGEIDLVGLGFFDNTFNLN